MTSLLAPEIADALPTPCLVVDVEACERNIERAAAHFGLTRAKLRPHFKAHKCTELLRRQVNAGNCVGVTCATAAEAEVVAAAGFDDVLVANQVVHPAGLAALARAAAASRVTVAVDDHAHVGLLSAQAADHGVRFDVLIEIDVGMGRCGLAPGSDDLLALAEAIASHDRLSLRGLQGYEGHAVLLADRAERREHVRFAGEILDRERSRLLDAGYACSVVSGGGTGTFDLATDAGVLDEVQAGSYALMDASYGRLDLPFENALFLVATLISRARPGAAAINAGLKALSAEYGMPKALDPGLEVIRLADEHATLSVASGSSPAIGDQVVLIPAHIDPAINLHDVLFAWDARSSTLETWRVDGRRREASEALL
jgi:D-serine deaminase-like pyridoxal phosphate-dependent protein